MKVLRYCLLLGMLIGCSNNSPVPQNDTVDPNQQDSGSPDDFGPTDTEPSTVPLQKTNISALWANEGGDKVTQHDLRASSGQNVDNTIYNSTGIHLFGAKNEVVSFNLILEASKETASNIKIQFDTLTNNAGTKIETTNKTDLTSYVNRPIELFVIKYLQIKGKSAFMGLDYDERHLPKRWQRPNQDANGIVSSGNWTDRKDANSFYPEIAIPIELNPTLAIEKGTNQAIWSDIFIPKNTPAGVYTGKIFIKEGSLLTWAIPVELTVKNFTLPDLPSALTMVNVGYRDINKRFLGLDYPNDNTAEYAKSRQIRDRFFQMAHRHKISLIDDNSGIMAGEDPDIPNSQWLPRLNGSLFTADAGYDGPGIGTSNNVFSIGTYSTWSFKNEPKATFWTRSDTIVNWFTNNAPNTDYFLYLIDESSNYALIEKWANWLATNPGNGKNLKSMATISLPEALTNTPSLSIPTSGMYVGDTSTWNNAQASYLNKSNKRFFMYNSGRPATGSFMTEEDGIALRVLSWAQFKKNIHRWFYWESTYYNNFQGGQGDTDVFNQAFTFGGYNGVDPVFGEHGYNYSNGDGVLFYPGTDKVFPNSSYNVDIPFASLRLKLWRRGIQDVDYLTLAKQKNPAKVNEIVNRIIPKVLWEYGVDDLGDPTYKKTPISWSDDPDVWEAARRELAEIILN